jgi:hypothetical protein
MKIFEIYTLPHTSFEISLICDESIMVVEISQIKVKSFKF